MNELVAVQKCEFTKVVYEYFYVYSNCFIQLMYVKLKLVFQPKTTCYAIMHFDMSYFIKKYYLWCSYKTTGSRFSLAFC